MNTPQSNEQKGLHPRTAMAHNAFRLHHEREPMDHDRPWIMGYVAALEDLPDEMLTALEQSR